MSATCRSPLSTGRLPRCSARPASSEFLYPYPMKTKFPVLAAFCALFAVLPAAEMNTLTPAETAAGWHLLFDGKSLDGWQASDKPGTFSVADGQIVVKGPRSRLFYKGQLANH